jgi:hypothetical protein
MTNTTTTITVPVSLLLSICRPSSLSISHCHCHRSCVRFGHGEQERVYPSHGPPRKGIRCLSNIYITSVAVGTYMTLAPMLPTLTTAVISLSSHHCMFGLFMWPLFHFQGGTANEPPLLGPPLAHLPRLLFLLTDPLPFR